MTPDLLTLSDRSNGALQINRVPENDDHNHKVQATGAMPQKKAKKPSPQPDLFA